MKAKEANQGERRPSQSSQHAATHTGLRPLEYGDLGCQQISNHLAPRVPLISVAAKAPGQRCSRAAQRYSEGPDGQRLGWRRCSLMGTSQKQGLCV